jgi:ketosteroid isomerase-like protein
VHPDRESGLQTEFMADQLNETVMTTEAEIFAAEERLRQAMLHSDLTALDALISPDLIFTSHLGQLVGKQDDLDFHRSGLFKLDELTPSEQRIQITDGVAIVSVLMHLSGRYAGTPFSENIRYTRVWSISGAKPLQVIAGHASTLATQIRGSN